MNFAIVLGLFLLSIVRTAVGEGRIIKGQEAHAGQFRYMVSITIIKVTETKFCGGSLIANNWVLSAAHCFDNAILVYAHLGAIKLQESKVGYTIQPSDILINPNFNSETLVNDIALIRIPYTEFCESIAPISIAPFNSKEISYSGQYGVTCGWGYTADRGQLTFHLRWGRIQIAGPDLCNKWFPVHPSHQLCVDTRTYASICFGDSGGPLILESSGELIGVTSYNVGHLCEIGNPNVFTRVSYYLDWVKSTTGIP